MALVSNHTNRTSLHASEVFHTSVGSRWYFEAKIELSSNYIDIIKIRHNMKRI